MGGRKLRSIVQAAAALSVAAAMCVGAPAALAAEQVVNFDDLADGTQVTNQYSGVVFTPIGNPSSLPTIQTLGAGVAHSNTKGAKAFQCSGGSCEFETDQIAGRFTTSRNHVTVFVNSRSNGGKVTLTARNSKQQTVGTATKTVPAAQPGGGAVPLSTQLTVTSTTPNIVFFQLDGAGYMDDFSFDVPDPGTPPPPPDFALDRDFTNSFDPGGDVGLVRGQTPADVKFLVTEFNGATGARDFTVSGLPAGVHGTFEPAAHTNSSAVTLHLTADANAASVDDANVTVTATPSTAQAGFEARTVTFPLDVHGTYDLRVVGMEITQGIQTQFTPCTTPAQCTSVASLPPSDSDQTVPYQGVTLVRHKKTLVRVFANRKTPQSGPGVDGVTVILEGFKGNKKLGTLVSSPTSMGSDQSVVTWTQRTDPTKGFPFVLPPDWTDGTVTLKATVVPPLSFIGTSDAECELASCLTNNKLSTTGVTFKRTGIITLATARLWVKNESLKGISIPCCFQSNEGLQRFYPEPGQVLNYADAVLPLQDGGLQYDPISYYASIEVTGLTSSDDALDKLDDYADDYPGCAWARFCADQIIGMYGNEVTTAGVSTDNPIAGGNSPYGVGNYRRPDSVTHELSHGYGRAHASNACGGGTGGQVGEFWPPEEEGVADGIGTDLRGGALKIDAARSLGAVGSSNSKAANFQPALWYDYMSYCRVKNTIVPAADKGIWTSVRGWEENVVGISAAAAAHGRLNASIASASASAASVAAPAGPDGVGAHAAGIQANLLRVRAKSGPGPGSEVTSIKPRSGKALAGPTGAAYAARTLNASGAVLATVPMKGTIGAIEPEGLYTSLVADVPSAGAARVEVLLNGAVIASRARSADAPTVQIRTPRAGARIGRRGLVTVSWTAADADGPSAFYATTVDYSPDDGKHWRPVYLGPAAATITIPSYLFGGSPRARVRVRVNDGFNESAAISGRFVALGRSPNVLITSPPPRTRVRADEELYLAGRAADDQQVPLRGRSLRWKIGRRLLGRGGQISAVGLPAGRRRIVLEARDRNGRVGRASVPITVVAVAPRVISLSRPARLGRSARFWNLRLATSIPATLSVGAQRFRVGRRARNVRLRVKPASGDLFVRLTLRAGRKTTVAILRVPRA
jgi:hypothetical protein